MRVTRPVRISVTRLNHPVRVLVGLALAVTLLMSAGCSGKTPTRTVQLQASSPQLKAQGDRYLYRVEINNKSSILPDEIDGLPWTSKAVRLKAGTLVTFSLMTTFDTDGPVTCEITSDGRVIAKASGSWGSDANCSAHV